MNHFPKLLRIKKNYIMENSKRIVLEWTEINGKKIPKRVIDIVPREKFPKGSKGNGKLIDDIFGDGSI